MNLLPPRPDENELAGRWEVGEGKLVADEVAQRIDGLVRGWFKFVAAASGGWERLLQDPGDGRFWELAFSAGDLGPPTLRVITEDVACGKYGISI